MCVVFFLFQAEDGIRDLVRSRGLGDVYKRQELYGGNPSTASINAAINQGVAFYNFRGWINMNGWPNTMNNMSNAYRLFHAIFITCSTGSWGGGTSTTESVVRYGTEAVSYTHLTLPTIYSV